MKRAAIFWGNSDLCYRTEPIICESIETVFNEVIENLLVDGIKKANHIKKEGVIPLLPGIFLIIEGEENKVRNLRIDNVYNNWDEKGDLIDYLIPSFVLLSTSYDYGRHDLNSKDDHILALGIAMLLGKKERISLRIDAGLITALKSLGKTKIGNYINIKIADLILRRYFLVGGLREKIGSQFEVYLSAPNFIMATERGFNCVITDYFKMVEHKETGEKCLVDYAIDKGFLETLKTMAKEEGSTVTSLIKEAITPRTGRWQEIEVQPI